MKHVGLLFGNRLEGFDVTDYGGVVGIRSRGGSCGGAGPTLTVRSEPSSALKAILKDVWWQLGGGRVIKLVVVHGFAIVFVYIDNIIVHTVSNAVAGRFKVNKDVGEVPSLEREWAAMK